ncbi:MAG TPA: 50S ribosomal protein L11 methyltransferase, partial [Verrucomicrobiota bacterium]|nr:50S ribosomal protein L11 methyltransferase [Verrucomicrobiota bacterium]
SFGTGQHATTRFCLEQLVMLRRSDSVQSLLDAGTGSGTLAISAAKPGYTLVEAFDFDAAAVRTATENCALNGLNSVNLKRLDLTRLPRRSRVKFDVVCANLLADLLVAERRRLRARIKPGGAIILAGILATQFQDVERAFAEIGFRRLQARTEKEWRSGLFRAPEAG